MYIYIFLTYLLVNFPWLLAQFKVHKPEEIIWTVNEAYQLVC